MEGDSRGRAGPEWIDAHHHFWRLKRGDYGWLTPELEPIYRDFEPKDLSPLLQSRNISKTILVQAAPTEDETKFLLDIARDTPWVGGVVGWVNMASPDAPRRMEKLAANSLLLGVRPMIQDITDPDWMLQRALDSGYGALLDLGLRFDALVLPKHLRNLMRLLDRYPEMRVVIDHGAKPNIGNKSFDDWAADISTIARNTGAVCKLSGLATEAGASWTENDLRPYVDHLMVCFGPSRLMWGSDWPVVNLAGGYERWWNATCVLLAPLSATERKSVLAGTAHGFYLA